MTATPADIAAGTRAATIQTWSDAAVKTRNADARDGSAEPAEGFFDSASDAVTAVTARGALIGVERRRFAVTVEGLHWPDVSTGLPTVTLIDPEQGVSAPALVCRVELRLQDEKTVYEVLV